MTTQTTATTDNERLSHLESLVEQILARLESLERRMDNLERSMDTLRIILFTGFGLMWATMVAGFIAILTFNS